MKMTQPNIANENTYTVDVKGVNDFMSLTYSLEAKPARNQQRKDEEPLRAKDYQGGAGTYRRLPTFL